MAMNSSTETVRQFWNSRAKDTISLRQVGRDQSLLQRDLDDIFEKLKINANDRVADFGCGNGTITVKIAQRAREAVGLDFADSLVENANVLAKNMGLTRCRAVSADLTKTNLKKEQFDFSVSIQTFHYFPDLDYATQVVSEMLRLLRPGGKILISHVPNKGHWGGLSPGLVEI